MKKININNIYKKCSLVLIVLTLIFISVFFVSAPIVSARDSNKHKTDYKTTDAKPTYTESLNTVNDFMNKAENAENLELAANIGKKWVDETLSILKAVKNSNGDLDEVDWDKVKFDLCKTCVSSIAAIWGLDGVTDAIFAGIEDLTSSGQAPLSEIQVLNKQMSQYFNQTSDKLNSIEKELGKLSNQVTNAANSIVSETSNQIENLNAKTVLREFMSSGSSGFSYLKFSNYLYGLDNDFVNPSEAYYNLLLEAQFRQDSESTKYFYDKLFDGLYSNIFTLNQYYFGELIGLDKSIIAYYYDYLHNNSHLLTNGKNAVYCALEFAYELYSTILYAYERLEMCYAYQIMDMGLRALSEDKKLDDNYYYQYNDTDRIYYSTIMKNVDELSDNISKVKRQIVKDIAYILSMSESYVITDAKNNIYNIGNYSSSFANVGNNQTIYLNIFSNKLVNKFKLDSSLFEFYLNDQKVVENEEKGIIDVSEKIKTFTANASLKYDGAVVYEIEFTNIDKVNAESNEKIYDFSGGSGTSQDPYLISNATQLYMLSGKISDQLDIDLNACYKLIDNIDFNNKMYPIGTENNNFNGVFDGNNFKISGIDIYSLEYDEKNITMFPSTGLFGTIGVNGEVRNLEIDSLKIYSRFDEDSISPKNPNSYFYIGGIAGHNKGLITNCTIGEQSLINVERNKNFIESINVEVLVGGIAGRNTGNLSYCTVDGVDINAKSDLIYGNESINTNKHVLCVGGIVGKTTTTISKCRVSNNTTINAQAKSTAESKDIEKPFLTVHAGGIVGFKDDYNKMQDVFSECTEVKCYGYIYNKGEYLNEHRYSYSNASVKYGKYYPITFEIIDSEYLEDYEKDFYIFEYSSLKKKKRDTQIFINYTLTGQYFISSSQEKDIEIEASKEVKQNAKKNYEKDLADSQNKLDGKIVLSYDDECFTINNYKANLKLKYEYDKLHKINDSILQIDTIKCYDELGNDFDIKVHYYYGFNTYHESEIPQTIKVTVLYTVDYLGVKYLMIDELNVMIEGKTIESSVVTNFEEKEIIFGTSEKECSDIIFDEYFELIYYYNNGEKILFNSVDNKDDIIIEGLENLQYGKKLIKIYHKDYPNIFATANLNVVCDHTIEDFILTNSVPATCVQLGYDIYECSKKCGSKIFKNYVLGEHSYLVTEGVPATCSTSGLTEHISCEHCETVFENAQWIQTLPHNYISIEEAVERGLLDPSNLSYNSDEYHYCTVSGHFEAHQYVMHEQIDSNGNLQYIFTCIEKSCNHIDTNTDNNIITDEKLRDTIVFINDGYVKNVNDYVTVYVQILNNIEFNAATFGIRYTDGLQLISFEEGDIIPQQLKLGVEVYQGINFIWASGKESCKEDGFLIKLVFKYIDEECKDQKVSIVYGDQDEEEGGFSKPNSNIIYKFRTKEGTISKVDHLPGDVTDDGVVDINDAIHIAWSLVNKLDQNGNPIDVSKRYADVNLDGKVNLSDVVSILQYISGNYGTNLLNSEYKLFFNLSGFENEEIKEFIEVSYYDERENRVAWDSYESFEKIQELMLRKGYKFVGWSNRLYGDLVDLSGYIEYDYYQANQTLYAQWEKNSIYFDLNGGTSTQIEPIIYLSNNYNVNLNEDKFMPELTYKVKYILKYKNDSSPSTIVNEGIVKEFVAWYYLNEKNEKVYCNNIDLSQYNLGRIKLYAEWTENYEWNVIQVDKEGYYNEVEYWLYSEYDDNTKINKNQIMTDEILSKISFVDGAFVLYGKPLAIQYVISLVNFDGTIDKTNTYTIETGFDFNDVIITKRVGYKFDGWFNTENKDGDAIEKIKTGSIGDRILYARYSPVPIKITIISIDPSKTNNDSYPQTYALNNQFLTLYYLYDDENIEGDNCGLYIDENCTNRFDVSLISSTLNDNNFIFKGCYNGNVLNNGHSNAKVNNNAVCYIGENGSCNVIPTQEITLQAMFEPKLYNIAFNINRPGRLESTFTSGNYSGHNLKIEYNAENRKYTLTNSSSDDPYCQIKQYVNLKANVDYYVHMKIEGSKKQNSVQMFYAIGGQYNESQSVRFGNEQTNVIRVDKDGRYLIRLDNDANTKITISDFWITESYTQNINVYYNEKTSNITMPQDLYYVSEGYFYGNVELYDENGNFSLSGYSFGQNITVMSDWTKRYDGTYITNDTSLNALSSSGDYYIVEDLDKTIDDFKPISDFTGKLNGLDHIVSNITIKQNSNGNFGIVKINNGIIQNMTISNCSIISTDPDVNGTCNAGLICGVNKKTISNIKIYNSSVGADIGNLGSNNSNYVYVGLVAGTCSAGTISNCYIYSCNIDAYVGTKLEDAQVYAGGLVGRLINGTISTVGYDTLNIKLTTKASWEKEFLGKHYHGRPYAYAGGIVGQKSGGTLANVTMKEKFTPSIILDRTCDHDTNKGTGTGDEIGTY